MQNPEPIFSSLEVLAGEPPQSAARNMAMDEALLRTVTTPVLRCYRWVQPAVSFGYFVPYAEVGPVLGGREAVRRWTGGGIVPHGEDFTFSLIVPRAYPLAQMPPAEAYRAIHRAVAAALGGATLAQRAAAKISEACFENPAESDVLLGPRKVAGGAQRRTAGGLLHQGSVQVPGLGPDFVDRLAGALSGAVAVRQPGLERELAAELAETRYATEAWLRRR